MLATYRCAYDDIDSDCNIMQVGYDSGEYQNDYFRFRTFELVANELIQENIEGECAEVGVYKGTFARLINQKFKDRQLYLFDTFDGFDSEEIKRSISDGDAWEVSEKAFKDTSEEIVLAQMPYPDKCVLRKGYFPNTSIGIENTLFAFVSIDVDLEESIYQSLKFFWPRLSIGGAIFVHDYNNRFFFGTRKGVERFKKETKDRINAIPIADQGGTLIIRK